MNSNQVAHSLSSSMSTSSISSCVGEASNNNTNVNNNDPIISYMQDDDFGTNCSLDEGNIGGYNSLHDLFQVLSEVPLHATATSPNQIVTEDTQGYHTTEEYVEVVKGCSKGKKLIKTEHNELPCDENRASSKKCLQRRTSEHKRRERINSKMRTIHALLPNCEKGDHASILDNAIKHIKSLQLQIDIMSRSIGQSQLQYQYAPQTIMQSTMVPRIGFGSWPSQMSPSTYPYMASPSVGVGFPVQAQAQAQAQAHAHAQVQVQVPFTSALCPIQYLPTTITTHSTPTVLSFAPSLPQFSPPNSSEEPPIL
nr:hypothetical protein [Suaeda aralocaspica]